MVRITSTYIVLPRSHAIDVLLVPTMKCYYVKKVLVSLPGIATTSREAYMMMFTSALTE